MPELKVCESEYPLLLNPSRVIADTLPMTLLIGRGGPGISSTFLSRGGDWGAGMGAGSCWGMESGAPGYHWADTHCNKHFIPQPESRE